MKGVGAEAKNCKTVVKKLRRRGYEAVAGQIGYEVREENNETAGYER